jgi:regulator of sirC expression with transglutaminase-like and TPR domain
MDEAIRDRFWGAAREPRPDLARLCLLAAAAFDPTLGDDAIDLAEIELDRLAGELPFGLREKGPREWAAATRLLLGGRHGFHGTGADYRLLESSLLPPVLRRRRGLPILLSVVWIEVARRAGGPAYGLALPGHFVVGFGRLPESGDKDAEVVLVDPFDGGEPLGDAELEKLLRATADDRRPLPTSAARIAALLGPAEPLAVVRRILDNIRAWAAARLEQHAVHLTAIDLALQLPSHPAALRRDRARLLVQRGEFPAGAGALEEYAEIVESADPAAATAARAEARAARARLN